MHSLLPIFNRPVESTKLIKPTGDYEIRGFCHLKKEAVARMHARELHIHIRWQNLTPCSINWVESIMIGFKRLSQAFQDY